MKAGSGVALALLAVLAAHAAPPGSLVYLENAQFIVSEEASPPPDGIAWRQVSLPHEWRNTDPGVRGLGWYRIALKLPRVPERTQALALAPLRSEWATFYVNGMAVGGSQDTYGTRTLGLGAVLFLTVPTSLFRPGENVLHVRMRTSAEPDNLQGLGRVAFGDSTAVRNVAVNQLELGFYADRAFLAMALAAGLISLFLWFANRTDTVILWFSIAFLSWGVVGIAQYLMRFADVPFALHQTLGSYRNYGLAVPAVVLAFRSAGRRWTAVEIGLWLALALALVVTSLVPFHTTIYIGWHIANAALLAGAILVVLFAGAYPPRWSEFLEASALAAMSALMVLEAGRFFGWIDVEAPILRAYHVPVMLLAFGAVVFERHVEAVRAARRSNEELQRRVDQKAREVEAYHAEHEAVRRQRLLVEERQRILADMHDGLGASLIGLLRYAEGGKVEPRVLEARVREALQELRIAIDALQPAEGDLGSVLANLRYRLEPVIASAGLRLVWRVPELPRLAALDPSAVLAIQRIVLEAVSNALRHSGGQQLRIGVEATGQAVVVEIADDGRGFEPLADRASGRGLTNMRSRAEALGGSLDILSGTDGGTRVRLALPYHLGREGAPAEAAAQVTSAG